MADSRRQGFVAVSIGSTILALALIVLFAFPKLYEKQLEKETTLLNNTLLYDIWKDLPLPIYQKLYFFNVTNGNDFMYKGVPLAVEEVGPYTYKSKWIKEEISWQNGSVSYREKKTFYFDPENSVGTEKDFIYTLNGPAVFAASFIEKNSPRLRKWANTIFNLFKERLVIRRTIGELAFGGYKDLLLKYGKYIQTTPFKDGNFAWLYQRNATDDGEFIVNTGEYNHSELNLVKSWNGSLELPFWENGSKCNKIRGTNAEIGPPIMQKQLNYTFFQPIFCRSMTFDYSEDITHIGISTKRFKSTEKIFGNKDKNPENYCFGSNNDGGSYISNSSQLSGVLNVSSCQFNAPVFLSFPHFYLADSAYSSLVDGMQPNESLHESYIDVEPNIGVSIATAIRFQVNVFVAQNQFFDDFKALSSGVYPILWVEMLAEIDDHLAKYMDDQMEMPKQIAYSILGIVIAISLITLVVGLYILYAKEHKNLKEEEKKPLLVAERKNSYDSTSQSSSDDDQCPELIISPTLPNKLAPSVMQHDKAPNHLGRLDINIHKCFAEVVAEKSNVKPEKISKT